MSDTTKASVGSHPIRELLATVPGRPIAFVVVSTFLGGVAGVLAGGLLGVYAPSYFQMVFGGFGKSWFSPLQIGLSLGLLQGGAIGLGIGFILVVATVLWRTGIKEPTEEWPWPTWTLASRWGPVFAIVTIVALVVGALSFVAGVITGQTSLYRSQAEVRMQLVRDWIDGRTEYANLEMSPTSDGHVQFSGSVQNDEAAAALHAQLETLFGADRSDRLLGNVMSETPSED